MFKNSKRNSFESEWEYRKTGCFFTLFIEAVILIGGFLIGAFLDYENESIFVWRLTAVLMIIAPFALNWFIKRIIADDMQNNPMQNKNTVHNFTFTETEMTIVSENSGNEISRISAKYEDIGRIDEKSQNLYFHINNQPEIMFLDAKGMTEGTFDELTKFLSLKCLDRYFEKIK